MKPFRHNRPRLFQAYCVGLPKTGTTSIANIFGHYRSIHEFQFREALATLCSFRDGKITERDVKKFVLQRDSAGWLEMDSSGLNYLFMDVLIREFPDARFIFTIRDCYSWCDSWYDTLRNDLINLKLNRSALDIEKEVTTLGNVFGFNYTIFKNEGLVIKNFDVVLEEMLLLWARNEEIIMQCPPSRRLIVRAGEISNSIKIIAHFLGITPETLISERSHSNMTCRKHHILQKVDSGLLERKFNKFVAKSSLMKEFFPAASLNKFLNKNGKRRRMVSRSLVPGRDFIDPGNCPLRERYPVGFWLNQADKAIRCSRHAVAQHSLEYAEGLKPERDELQHIVALYLKSGKPFYAKKMISAAGGASDIDSWLLRAEVSAACGQRVLAKRSLAYADRLMPGSEALRRMAGVYMKLGDSRHALAKAQQFTVCRAHDIGSWLLQAEVAASCGRLVLARRSLAYAEKLMPSLDALRRMAELYIGLDQPLKALEKAQQLTACNAQDIDLWMLQAVVAASCGQRALAKHSLEHAESLSPGPDALHYLVVLCRRIGKDSLALELLRHLAALRQSILP